MSAAEEKRKVLCPCGKPLAVFDAKWLSLYCRFSKETTTVPYGLRSLAEAIAFVEPQRREARQPAAIPGVRKSLHVKKSGRWRMDAAAAMNRPVCIGA